MSIVKAVDAFNPIRIVNDLASLNIKQLGFLGVLLAAMVGLSMHWGDSPLGYLASVTGVICVFLVNMRKLSNYFWGVINVTAYGYVSYQASYLGDFTLNIFFYLPIQFIGAYMWATRMDTIDSNVVARKITDFKTVITLALVSVVVTWAYSIVLGYLGGNLPLVDSTTTVLAVLASWFMVYGYREQWVVWIVINVLSIGMWAYRYTESGEGIAIMIMWCVFLANSIYGAYTWFKASK